MYKPTRRRTHNAPIPGTQPPPRGLFIDRWGTLLHTQGSGLPEFSNSAFTPRALDALFRVARTDWSVYLIGNEDAVAHGHASDDEWTRFENELLEHLRAFGVNLRRNYVCLDDPLNGTGSHRKGSVFRLPDTGIFFHAAQQDGLNLRQSFVIGDSTLEIAAGARAGCRTVGVRTGVACRDRQLEVEPDLQTDSLADALELFLRSEACVRQ